MIREQIKQAESEDCMIIKRMNASAWRYKLVTS